MICSRSGNPKTSTFTNFTNLGNFQYRLPRYGDKFDGIDVLCLIEKCASFEATDPRDKVYGLLGLLGERHTLFPVDYGRSVDGVYADFVIHHITTYGILDVIFRSNSQRQSCSWLPDLYKMQRVVDTMDVCH